MKYLLSILITISLFSVCSGQSVKKTMTNDETLAIPKLTFDANGELVITASQTSSKTDFDFLVGKWRLSNRKLKKRLENNDEWTEFESSVELYKILNGIGNIDSYKATFDGKPFEGMTLRLYNPKTRLWSLYWADSNVGVLDPPVVGSFDNNNVGHFFTKDTFNGKKIIMLFRWDARNKEKPVWSQAFSPDNGKTWEWNWFNESERIK